MVVRNVPRCVGRFVQKNREMRWESIRLGLVLFSLQHRGRAKSSRANFLFLDGGRKNMLSCTKRRGFTM